MPSKKNVFSFIVVQLLWAAVAFAQAPYDIWTPEVMQRVRDQNTLNPQIATHLGYFEVSYDSEIGTANWADSSVPYGLHTGDTIRIHGYLATPLFGGPYPAVVIGHGHGGHGSPEVAMALAAFGYVALSIDGPMAGQSTGGPQDTEQAWVSVEPAADYSYLYHYAYAGMRALTLLERLSTMVFNPLRIDRNNVGVIGASMGGQFVYYINGIDDRVKAAVALAAAGNWGPILFYPGAWLYHGLFYYTRDGLPSGVDAINTVSNVCTDPTLSTFLDHFDPVSYASTQHGPLLTVIGTHDQYFTAPAINSTFDRVQSAGANQRFLKRMLLMPNAEHGLIDEDDLLHTFAGTVLPVLQTVHQWLRYSFRNGAPPAETPTVNLAVSGDQLVFTVTLAPGSRIQNVRLFVASQINTLHDQPNDFALVPLSAAGADVFTASVPIGATPPNGPPLSSDNVLYFAQVDDAAGYTLSSKLYYRNGEMTFGSGFVPVLEHYPKDSLPTQPPPLPCATTP